MNIVRTYGIAVGGALLLVVGVVVLLSQQLTTGGTVVSPVDATGPVPEPTASDPTLGILVALVGLVLVAGWVGFRIGRRGQGAQSRS